MYPRINARHKNLPRTFATEREKKSLLLSYVDYSFSICESNIQEFYVFRIYVNCVKILGHPGTPQILFICFLRTKRLFKRYTYTRISYIIERIVFII